MSAPPVDLAAEAYTSVLERLARTLGRVEATAINALERAKHSDSIDIERDDLAAALREIRAMCRAATQAGAQAARDAS